MSYPIRAHEEIAPRAVATVPFRPAAAGLVKVLVSVEGQPPSQPGGDGKPPAQPRTTPSYSYAVHIEVLKPGETTPAIDLHASRPLWQGKSLVWGDTMAAAADLGADWIVRLTNTSSQVTAVCDVTVRYQVVPGDLGKFDHVVVLMMENRSFDQMLGYLSLEEGRADVDGLTGSEENTGTDGVHHPAHHYQAEEGLPATYFRVDPGHGWNDVNEQLGRVPGGNFVTNFEKVVGNLAAQSLTMHDETPVDGESDHQIGFRPLQFGRVYMSTKPAQYPSPLKSEDTKIPDLLCVLDLLEPGQTQPVASATVRIPDWENLQRIPRSPCDPAGQTAFGLEYEITPQQFAATAGRDWTFRITNGTIDRITFASDVTLLMPPPSPGAVMGYYNKDELGVYDFLASEYLICNRWFASLPTDTWPNRLYCLTGGSGGMKETPSGASVATSPPGYDLKTIFEVLQEHGVEWNVFFTDLPFPLVFRHLAQDAEYTQRMRPMDEFRALAAQGELPPVSWLEPNFTDVPDGGQFADDDHPPGDVSRGQKMIGELYDALAQSPGWSKTLFLITYDEHGGFFDHVQPPLGESVPDDDPGFRYYGVRVPTFVVSAWVPPKSVSNVVFDHTSVLATILRRFCAAPDGSVPSMGLRADHANDVGPLLSADTPRASPPLAPGVDTAPQPSITPATNVPQPNELLPFGVLLRVELLGL